MANLNSSPSIDELLAELSGESFASVRNLIAYLVKGSIADSNAPEPDVIYRDLVKVTTISGAEKGKVEDVVLEKNLTTGVTTYFYVAGGSTTSLPVEQIIGKQTKTTGHADMQDIAGVSTFSTKNIIIPPYTQYAIGHIDGGSVVYTIDGENPIGGSDTYGRRVQDGGLIQLKDIEEINNLHVLALEGTPDISWEFKNHQ